MDRTFALNLMPFPKDDVSWVTRADQATLALLNAAYAADLKRPDLRSDRGGLRDFRGALICRMQHAVDWLACRASVVLGSVLDSRLGRMAGTMMPLDVSLARSVTQDCVAAMKGLRSDVHRGIRARRHTHRRATRHGT